jgi:hypothetical protein
MPAASSMGPEARMNPRPTAGVAGLERDNTIPAPPLNRRLRALK